VARDIFFYDILKNLKVIQPNILMKQLLTMTLQCHTSSQASLIRQRNKTKDVKGISLNLDPSSPIVNFVIDGVLIIVVEVYGSSNINLMIVETMEELGLTQLKPTTLTLKMANQSQVKPMGFLLMVHNIIVSIEYKIDYIMFKLLTLIFSYPILLGKFWLYKAKTKIGWGKGTLTLGQHETKLYYKCT